MSYDSKDQVLLLKNPYPYKAMLAICSDLDQTESAHVYFSTVYYLNSNSSTAFGNGINLEVGNTIFFYMKKAEFAYWSLPESDQATIRQLIRTGHIDCFHSFGDLANTRDQARKVLDHLTEHDCRMKVWIDHAVAPTNVGRDIMRGRGDVPGANEYHVDMTTEYGVKYFWMGRVSSCPAQDAPPTVLPLFKKRAPFTSSLTMVKERSKQILGHLGSRKYELNGLNVTTKNARLRDGREVVEFLRSNPNYSGVAEGATSRGLAIALQEENLNHLQYAGGRTILYTHLGKEISPRVGFPQETRERLEELRSRMDSGEILVTTTSRLLDYVTQEKELQWSTKRESDVLLIQIEKYDSSKPLDGINFEVPRNLNIQITASGKTLQNAKTIAVYRDRAVFGFKWEKLNCL